jgi:hypothetical protein
LSTKPVENSVDNGPGMARRANDFRHLTYLPKNQATQEILEIPGKKQCQSERTAGMSRFRHASATVESPRPGL